MTKSEEYIEGPRACESYEVAPTLGLLASVNTPEIGMWFPHVYCEANRENMRIIKVNGRVAASASICVYDTQTPRGELKLAEVSAVSCHPDFRRRGFGNQVVESCMERMRQIGCQLGVLPSDINDWYRKLGWENAGRRYSFQIDRANVQLLPVAENCQIQQEACPDVAQMLELYHHHNIGARRQLEVFEVLLSRPDTDVYTASRGGKLISYIVVREEYIAEFAGEPVAALALVRAAFGMRDDLSKPTSTTEGLGRMKLEAPYLSEGLPRLLLDLGLPYSLNYLRMMWVPHLPGLLEALGLEDITAEETDDTVRLFRGDETVELTRRELVKLIFGPEHVADFAPDVFPVSFHQWPLDAV